MEVVGDITFRRDLPIYDASTMYGRYWRHEDILYAEVEKIQKRFFVCGPCDEKRMAEYAKRIQTTSYLTFKWHEICPYEDNDPSWIAFLTHTAGIKYDKFRQRLLEAKDTTARERARLANEKRLEEMSAESEKARVVWFAKQEQLAEERKAREAAKAEDFRKAKEERERQAKAQAEHRAVVRLVELKKLATALGLAASNDVDEFAIAEALDSLPIPDEAGDHLNRLDAREQATVLAWFNGIRMTHLAPFFGVSRNRMVQVKDKAIRRLERWKSVEQAEKARSIVLGRPKLEFESGPLMEWTAEMQAAELSMERSG